MIRILGEEEEFIKLLLFVFPEFSFSFSF